MREIASFLAVYNYFLGYIVSIIPVYILIFYFFLFSYNVNFSFSTYHIGKPLQLPACDALEHHGHGGAPVAGADGEAVDGAQDADDAVAGDVEHCRGYHAVCLCEAVSIFCFKFCISSVPPTHEDR